MSLFKLFHKNNSQKVELSEVTRRLDQLEKLIIELEGKNPTYHITVERLDIHDPKLENLTFKLDQLDIKDLSGALNLGNNLGISVNHGDKKQKESIDSKVGITKKENGFNIKLNNN